jgi:hypothetical protein
MIGIIITVDLLSLRGRLVIVFVWNKNSLLSPKPTKGLLVTWDITMDIKFVIPKQSWTLLGA